MERKTPKVSIVVPMYRCEDTLERCVDAVLTQTCPDFELLLINDGSPDRVPEIAAGYVQRDPRVRLLSQENRGVSAARNAGIDAAKGRYLLFVDADDRLCKDAVETPVSYTHLDVYKRQEWNRNDVCNKADQKCALPRNLQQVGSQQPAPQLQNRHQGDDEHHKLPGQILV